MENTDYRNVTLTPRICPFKLMIVLLQYTEQNLFTRVVPSSPQTCTDTNTTYAPNYSFVLIVAVELVDIHRAKLIQLRCDYSTRRM